SMFGTAPDSSAISTSPDPWIDEGVDCIEKDRYANDDDGECQDEPLNNRIVALEDRFDRHATDAVPGKDVLDHDGAAHHEGELKTHHRDDRNEPRAKDVTIEHHRLGQPLRFGGADEVLTHNLYHRRARHAGDDSGIRESKRDSGEHEIKRPGPTH